MRSFPFLAVSCCILIAVTLIPDPSVSMSYEEEPIKDKGNSNWLIDMETIGPVDTYEDYIKSREEKPFSCSDLRPSTRYGGPYFNSIIVLVEEELYENISSEIDIYLKDLKSVGYSPFSHVISGGSVEDLKDLIIGYNNDTYDLQGAVLIGDLPCAWFRHENDFNSNPSQFPCDLFLMDMDGSWLDNDTNGVYDSHSDGDGDTAPEIFVGRIDASTIPGDEIDITRRYLSKVHRFWTGSIDRLYKGLTYTEKDWAGGDSFQHDISSAYGDHEAVFYPDVDRNDYINNRLPGNYDFIQLSCHSGSTRHYFTKNGTASNTEVREAPPEAVFYNLFCCSSLRFTSKNCLGSSYILDTNTSSLAVIGSSKTGSMLQFNDFYTPLGRSLSFGGSFREWFRTQAPYADPLGGFNEVSWYYGMTILGDPTLVPITPMNVYVDDDFGPYTSGWLSTHFQDLQTAVSRVRTGGAVWLKEGIYNGSTYLNRTVYLMADVGAVLTGGEDSTILTVNGPKCTLWNIDIKGQDGALPEYGILINSNDNTIKDCVIDGCEISIGLNSSGNNTLQRNSMDRGGVTISGVEPGHYTSHSIDDSNKISDRSIHYAVNLTDPEIPTGVGQIIIMNSTRVVIENQIVHDCGMGILVYNSNECRIINNTISSNDQGLIVRGSSNLIESNNFENNSNLALKIESNSQGTGICHNNFIDNGDGSEYVLDLGTSTLFDDGEEGNHWSDWIGPDEDRDGIVDVPYNRTGDRADDRFPLVYEYGIPVLLSSFNRTASEDVVYGASFEVRNTDLLFEWDFGSNADFLSMDQNGSVHGLPSNDDVGQFFLNITVSTEEGFDFENYTLTVLNVNDPPVMENITDLVLTEDEFFNFTFQAVDIDPVGDDLTWYVETDTTFLQIDNKSGELFGVPTNDHVGNYFLNISVDDGEDRDWKNITLEVENINDPPLILTEKKSFCLQGDLYNLSLTAVDPDPTNDSMIWSFSTNASFLQMDCLTGMVTGVPSNDDVGTWRVDITLSDGLGGIARLNYNLTVNNTNDRPEDPLIMLDGVYQEGAPQIFVGSATDPDLIHGDMLNLSWYLNGTLIGSGPVLNISLPEGNYTIVLNVTDLDGTFISTSVLITILPDPEKEIPDKNRTDDDTSGKDVYAPLGIVIILVLIFAVMALGLLLFFRRKATSSEE
ncbi:MAG: NosD domain-containing protein [Candidatus Thermoplasmatota archaeon]|nr:NosD domain-containing protein [Candidatus Thermoplasmatota archaeon]